MALLAGVPDDKSQGCSAFKIAPPAWSFVNQSVILQLCTVTARTQYKICSLSHQCIHASTTTPTYLSQNSFYPEVTAISRFLPFSCPLLFPQNCRNESLLGNWPENMGLRRPLDISNCPSTFNF